jgi:ABC-type Zn uptake system ZnuABC Zn-binding protein ZnuA
VVTLHPLRLIVHEIVGDALPIRTLLPAGVSPHAYDPVPSAARSAATAVLVLAVQPSVDGWAAALGSRPVWWFGDADPRTNGDPHFWLDPLAVKATLPSLTERLCTLRPRQCGDFKDRSARFGNRLDVLVSEGRTALQGRLCVVSAPFLSGFARRFGMEILDTVSPVEGVEPSTGDIQQAIAASRKAGLLIAQASLPDQAPVLVSQVSGARLVVVDILGGPETTPDYESLISRVIEQIRGEG